MIEITNISKSFDGTEVLNGISSSFLPGKTNLIIGQSGSGKSVLMKCMVGLLTPESGSIDFDGRDFLALQEKELRGLRREIGMLFQGTALFDSSTVQQNIEFPLRMFTTMSAAERLDRVNFCLEQVHMEGVNKKYPAEISGGMKKRVGIARAIAMDIKYLFCDEPNSGLDPITARVIDELITEITGEFKVTTIVNTHDMKTVFDIGDHIIFIHDGQKWWEGERNEVKRAGNKELQDFINASYFED